MSTLDVDNKIMGQLIPQATICSAASVVELESMYLHVGDMQWCIIRQNDSKLDRTTRLFRKVHHFTATG
jgi:hypothetical protein